MLLVKKIDNLSPDPETMELVVLDNRREVFSEHQAGSRMGQPLKNHIHFAIQACCVMDFKFIGSSVQFDTNK